MTIGFILIIIITRFLRRTQKEALSEKWHRQLNTLMIIAIALIVIEIPFSSIKEITEWISHAMLLYIIYILYNVKEFRGARQVLSAIAPFVIISFLHDVLKILNKSLYSTLSGWLETGIVFAIIWMIAMLIITNRQKKAIDKEKLKLKQEEEQNKIISQMKAELEVQVAERTAELTRQKEELENALHDLRATQNQLIQAEKMASLGELTAGIAHEIQNPLNFVNNFSEVNKELIEELKNKNEKFKIEDTESTELLNDIAQNLEKINFHGKRADAIVKGMLQHSRKSTGQKELTDINALADEYLRLAYHGLRAKDKSFNASFKTDFDNTIGKIDIVPQDIGRVLLNLINNAFYTVNEKRKVENGKYEPVIFVKTKKTGGKAEITVRDNGNGIPQNIIDKIFQPFFTTKPTGQGTGLGLSLSYEIVTKGHGGELKVQSKEGEGSEFIIFLPIQ